MKEIILMLGLPGAGKTEWIKGNINKNKYVIISADEIRLGHPNYNPKDPESIHEECVKMAKENVIAVDIM